MSKKTRIQVTNPWMKIAGILLLFVLFGTYTTPVSAAEYGVTRISPEYVSSAVKKVMPAVVSIVSSKDVPQVEVIMANPFVGDRELEDIGFEIPVGYRKTIAPLTVGVGSGFIGTHDGYIITAKHVVDDDDTRYTVMLSDGRQKPGVVVYRDPDYDIALMKIEGTYDTIATLGQSSTLQEGDEVSAVGNAFGKYSKAISRGTISDFDKSISASDGKKMERLTGLLETTAPLVPGYSGGPLIDSQGNIIGLDVAIDTETGLGYAIPIDVVKQRIPLKPFVIQ